MRIVILQSAGQIKHYFEKKRQANDLVIPIGPIAMFYSDMYEWKTCSLCDLWTSKDYDQARDESQARIDSLIDALDVYSKEWNSDIDLEIGRYYAFQIFGLVGHLHYNYYIAHSIASRFQSVPVLIYTKDIEQASSELNPDPDCIFARVAFNSGCFKNDRIEIQKVSENRATNTIREFFINALPHELLMQLRNIRSKWRIRNFGRTACRLLLIGGEYDWIKISRYKRFKKIFSFHVIPHLVASIKGSPPKKLVDILNCSVEFTKNVVFDMESIASSIYADMLLYAEKNEEIHNKLKQYDAIVTAVLTNPFENYLAHTAAKINKPVIVWQHGEKGQAQDVTVLYTELFYATDYLTYGTAVTEQYRSWIDKNRLVNVETVGSLGKRVNWSGEGSIVYATGKWFTTSVPFSSMSDPDTRLYRAHKTILDYLDTIAAGHSVIFKANNTLGANTIPYNYAHVCIDYSTPFTELLNTASVIILDTPATTLVESCSTNVPIFVLDGRTKYLPDFLNKIKRRVVWCDTPSELVTKLAAYLSKGTYDADVTDDSYLREYCASTESSEVILKVKESLLSVIDRSRNAGMR